MEAVLIDQFVVPEGVVEEFLQHVHFSRCSHPASVSKVSGCCWSSMGKRVEIPAVAVPCDHEVT